jgi:DNA mismatch repair protein MutS
VPRDTSPWSLKEYEEKILGAEENILKLETELYTKIIEDAIQYIQAIQQNASVIAHIDCLLSFAALSVRRTTTASPM